MPSYVLKRKTYKYYKDTVVTKYWKEVTTGVKELKYACYKYDYGGGTLSYWYAKAPLGSDMEIYGVDIGMGLGKKISDWTTMSRPYGGSWKFTSISEDRVTFPSGDTHLRSRDDDLYADTTVTTTVEGTPDDYTYTTTETVTTEVTANDDYDSVEVGVNTYLPIRRQQGTNGVTQLSLYSFNRK